MDIFLAAFDDLPNPRAANVRHDLCGLLVVGFVAVLCGAVSRAEMSDFGRAKQHIFRGFQKLSQILVRLGSSGASGRSTAPVHGVGKGRECGGWVRDFIGRPAATASAPR